LLERLGIADIQDRYPGELSGGQRQRAAAARAFVLRPDLMLMDEPFSSLDALTREQAQELYLDLWRGFRPTTVLATHSIEEAVLLGGKILVLSRRPGMAVEFMDNPVFGVGNPRGHNDFFKTVAYIRELARRQWEIRLSGDFNAVPSGVSAIDIS
jgi:NitT/TauT family transport system ATP-binding protein